MADNVEDRAQEEADKDQTQEESEESSPALAAPSEDVAEPPDSGNLRRKRGTRLAAFTRTCHRAEALMEAKGSRTTLETLLEHIDVKMEEVVSANEEYVASLTGQDEISSADEYLAKAEQQREDIVQRIGEHLASRNDEASSVFSATATRQRAQAATVVDRTEEEAVTAGGEAIEVEKSSRRQEQENEPEHLSRQKKRPARASAGASQVSRASRVSSASKEAEIEVEMRSLELKQLKAKQARERHMRRRREEEEDLLEQKAMEEELERAALKARLCRAAEDDLEWERRHDFDGEAVDEEEASVVTASDGVQACREEEPLPDISDSRRRKPPHGIGTAAFAGCGTQEGTERRHVNWEDGERAKRPHHPLGPSAFVHSIPRLSLPTFRGSAQEWPRWIGLFRALVHNQPSLTNEERMAHLQNAVEGPAAQAIDGMLFNGDLYPEAMKTLQDRFGRDQDIIGAHLQKIFALPSPALTDLPAMEKFYSVLHNTVTVLRSLGYINDLRSSENLRRVVEKLPSELAREWGREVSRTGGVCPTLETLSKWLQEEVKVLSLSSIQSRTPDRRRPTATPREGTVRRAALATGATFEEKAEPRQPPACVVCNEFHRVSDCPVFKAKEYEARMEVAFNESLCFSCLRKGHLSRKCRSARKCGLKGCKFMHHRLLHRDTARSMAEHDTAQGEGSQREPSAPPEEDVLGEDSRHQPFVAAATKNGTDTLLQIVTVRVHGSRGSKDVLALLDTGAQMSLCSEDVLKELGVRGERHPLRIQTVQTSSAQQSSEKVSLTISTVDPQTKKRQVIIPEVWSVPSLNVSAGAVTNSQLRGYQHLRGLDFPQYNGGSVELLIGANVLEAVLQKEVRMGRPNQPVAVKTDLGWTLTGSISAIVPSSMRQVMFIRRQESDEDDLSAVVNEWWSTEAFGTKYREPVPRSEEDIRALTLLTENTKGSQGRYQTSLLWKEGNPTFPNNKAQAMQRLQATERKLKANPEVAAKYKSTIDAYVTEGHARKLTPQEAAAANERRWLLPHHAVTNPNKPGKVRVVFDAAAVYRGVSLNEKLLTGPDLLQSLPGVLLRFREDPVAVAADIKQMYHQIKIVEKDQPALSFLWRDLDCSRPPDMYQMQVLIFGARSSPAIANYVLGKTLQEHWMNGATASGGGSERVQRSFYMDDFLQSVKDVDEARRLKQEATRALSKGGFQLTKWRSNEHQVLQGTSPDDLANADNALCLGASTAAAEKTLGVVWDENKDMLGFRLRQASEEPLTKRGVLSRAASVFDPLGIAAPFTVQARIMMQQLWSKQLSWDEPLPEPELTQWLSWLQESSFLSDISVARCIVPEVDVKSRELHVFCDASESAFGAVIYMRSTTLNDVHHCRFLIAKNRVAPLKKLSIVRLELQAALLGARLADAAIRELSKKPAAVYYWSDSNVVLQYLSNESRRFHTFVANRVAEIKELTAGGVWRHVPGKLNPADDCSRGLAASELTTSGRWLSGPGFLRLRQEEWPLQVASPPLTSDVEEVKPTILVTAASSVTQPVPDPSKFSCWLKYRRVAAWVRRFIHNAAAHTPERAVRRTGPLNSQELEEAEIGTLRQAQEASYPEETRCLAQGKNLPTKSGLLPLSPYCDDNGLLRVGGRLANAPVAEATRHPIILPQRGEVARLVILQHHIKCGHAGVEHTLNEMRQKFWVVRGRTVVKHLLGNCPTCRRLRALPKPPRMASLPAERFHVSRPFHATGIDIFGPMYVKRFRKTEKRYGLLATCMATRAVHLEVVHSLDTDSCIMALRRFFARRGRPSVIRSDNGTNFVGSCRELRAELRAMEKEIAEKLSAFEIDWRFNPPAASHMGGVWERMVRSVKNSLKVVVGRQTLTDEVLVTVLAEVEHMVNSRPLTHVSCDPTDPEALTPNHFLLGSASKHLPPGIVRDRDLCSRRRWKHVQAVAEHVWKRWIREYLPTLIQRTKWRQEQRNLQVGDLVMMMEPNLSRGSWPLARVKRVFPAKDKRVRSAELQTASGKLYTRPATKICFLEEECM